MARQNLCNAFPIYSVQNVMQAAEMCFIQYLMGQP